LILRKPEITGVIRTLPNLLEFGVIVVILQCIDVLTAIFLKLHQNSALSITSELGFENDETCAFLRCCEMSPTQTRVAVSTSRSGHIPSTIARYQRTFVLPRK
jgi:DNA polymerase III delta prime subunit